MGVLRFPHIALEVMGAAKRFIWIEVKEEGGFVIDVVCLAHDEREQF